MTEELVLFVDYIGNSKYGIFVDNPTNEKPDFILNSVAASLEYIINNYGIDSRVEISHCAEIIFKLENNINLTERLS